MSGEVRSATLRGALLAVSEHTGITRSTAPVVVTKLHYVFDGWLGGALIEMRTPSPILTGRVLTFWTVCLPPLRPI